LRRKKHQFDIQKKSAKISADDTFRQGSEIFEDPTGQNISDHFIHDSFEEVGIQGILTQQRAYHPHSKLAPDPKRRGVWKRSGTGSFPDSTRLCAYRSSGGWRRLAMETYDSIFSQWSANP
jgi:hypothetical protein